MKAYAKNKNDLRKKMGAMGIIPRNIKKLNVRNSDPKNPWFSFKAEFK